MLKGIDLTVSKGEYLLLCGGSGSGKSTLGYLLNGLIPHFFGGKLEGRVLVLNRDTKDLSVAALFPTVGLVFQNTDAQLFNSTVENEIAFGLESLGLQGQEIDARIGRTAADVGIEHLLKRSPNSLSGGEKRLAAIASVICQAPPILVLDEPLAHLDWLGAKRVRRILCRLHDRGVTVVVIEQRVKTLLEDVTRCVIMDRGALRFDGSPAASESVLREQHLVPRYPVRPAPRSGMPDDSEKETLLEVKNVCYEIGRKPILHHVSLKVRTGEILAIVGPNGAGKTTLVRQFNGLLHPHKGEVCFMGEKIGRAGPSRVAGRIGISFQNPNDQFFKTSVSDELRIGLKFSRNEPEHKFRELCDLFHLHELLDRSPYRLSEGQKKRVSVASILAMGPGLLVLDEPTVGQDGRFLEALAFRLLYLSKKGVTIVVVTHDLEFAWAVSEKWAVIHNGRLSAVGEPGDLMENSSFIRPEVHHFMGLDENGAGAGQTGGHGS
ncbi:MAG: energy-coupling factor ABC transporter ATP-binding protein [Deltaproteobacteria bacterium]|nr:energy-coupling factor ABC transporter ATP-binding protein [Deltaproteobacteria bacterium]